MSAYGQIKVSVGASRNEIHTLSFGDKSAWFDAEFYIRTKRKDLTIIDSFWGYALYRDSKSALEALEAFAPK
jgi:hypothetical protein